jgi:hypothetical protein
MEAHSGTPASTLDAVQAVDTWARQYAQTLAAFA